MRGARSQRMHTREEWYDRQRIRCRPPVDHELMKMRIAPTEGDLDDGVQPGDGCVIGDQQAAPDQRADSLEPDAELVDSRGVRGGHTAPRSTEAVSQSAVPCREGRGQARRGDYTGNE